MIELFSSRRARRAVSGQVIPRGAQARLVLRLGVRPRPRHPPIMDARAVRLSGRAERVGQQFVNVSASDVEVSRIEDAAQHRLEPANGFARTTEIEVNARQLVIDARVAVVGGEYGGD